MLVYHGSNYKFNIAKPSQTIRSSIKNGKQYINYKGISLHATPYKWIALSYIFSKNIFFIHNKKKEYFSVGVSLFENNKEVTIYGKKSLEYSLNKIYKNGGYLYTFDANKFKYFKGLGQLEVLSYEKQIPKNIEYITNPAKIMKQLNVKFIFVDKTK
jgi:hypothetical protein